ncbi:hypothetical protein HanPSC8_Chr14g0595601 [Helianthus annuus]|nr:hypothetical protein HanIR_Chr14g0671461 [Helianthus annuus]KAJ0654643.1 hypothetical protein HanLR1_Chr14g0509451 [Helianthus annuus]KAJ0838504.1 hypothetical protein HanPSC8_Chr14g0595601 [Helianthus annuus]
MKEAMYADELKLIQVFKPTKNEWYVKELGRRRRLATPIAEGEGLSSKPKRKQKKKAQTMLIDEPDEEIPAANVEKEQEMVQNIEINEDVFTSNLDFVENVVHTVTSEIQKEKMVEDIEGDDVDKDTTSSSRLSDFEMVDTRESEKRMREELEKEKLLRKRKRDKKEDEPYIPSPEHASVSKSTPRVKTKAVSRKKDALKIRLSKRPQKILQTPPRQPTPSHQPTPPQSLVHKSPPSHSTPPRLPTPQRSPSPIHQSTPPQQPIYTSQDLFTTPPLSQIQHGSSSKGLPTPQDNLLDIGNFDFANNAEIEKDCLWRKSEADQSEIDILKVRDSELEEEKSRRDAQNEYFELKHKVLNEAKRAKDHELFMLHKVVESMLGSSVEERFEEIQVAEVRAEIDRQMKDKGKGLEGSSAAPILDLIPAVDVENPQPISAISGLFEEPTSLQELIGDSSEEDDDEEEDGKEYEKDDFVFSASSHSSKDDDDDDDDDTAGGSGVRVTDASNEKVVDDLMNDTVNEENDEASGKGESDKNQIVEHYEPLFLNLDAYKESLKDVNSEIPFDFEEELESFDINKQKDYKYNYVEDADQYDRVEVEDCSDTEDVPEDTLKLPSLMEFFAAENRDELRQKVTEAVNENVFEGLRKEAEQEGQSSAEEIDRSKWFKNSHERNFKRPLKYFQRDRSVSLGDIISWGFLPQVNAYAVRREYGV